MTPPSPQFWRWPRPGHFAYFVLVSGVVGLWFAVVYMAEHWIIDVAAGVVLTVLAYALVEGVAAAWAARAHRREATEAVAAAMSALSHKAGRGR